ncbi:MULTISPECIES: hypothetical protein [Gordonia]|uniref:hypothetical protein n=1 Tax=Gordonia TaxID=2053 RepID=UPI00204471AE|nr:MULTISPECIES: hypothetical protein [Gordonia]MCM3895763.1 hypothetical protein [Gordonia sputi]
MATMSEKELATALDRAIGIINPILDALASSDPLGIKASTFDDDPQDRSRLDKLRHVVAHGLDIADWPGTRGWSELSIKERAKWWVKRVGSLNNVAVSYPGVFGAWAKALPLSSALGYANQAIVLTAVAREYGVTERNDQVRLLASVLSGRELSSDAASNTDPFDDTSSGRKRRGWSLISGLWEVAQILRKANDELDRRPGPPKLLGMLSYIPVVGAPITYVGESFALRRAVSDASTWIKDHPESITVSQQQPDGTPRPHA